MDFITIALTLVSLGVLVLAILALVQIVHSDLDVTGKGVWALVVLLAPLIGPLVWLAVRRKRPSLNS